MSGRSIDMCRSTFGYNNHIEKKEKGRMENNKRYYSVDYDEEYYIFDSKTITKEEVDEKSEYSYDVFADSLTSTEVVNKLNSQEERIHNLRDTLAYRSNQLSFAEQLIEDLGSDEMKRQWEEFNDGDD